MDRYLAVPTPVMFLNLADDFPMSGSKIWKHLGRISKIEIKMTTLGAFLLTVHYEVIGRLAPEAIICFCGEDFVLIRVAQGELSENLSK